MKRFMGNRCRTLLTLLGIAQGITHAHSDSFYVKATLLIPIQGDPIPNGVLLVDQGKIVALGTQATIQPPDGAVVVEGEVVMPGFVDTHSHIGEASGSERSTPIQPELRVLDGFNCLSPSVERARAAGITTVNVMNGSGLLISGETLHMKLRRAPSVEGMMLTNSAGQPSGGLKMANGTNPRKAAPFPGTRAKAMALVRAEFIKAAEYDQKRSNPEVEPGKKPAKNLALETLAEVLKGERVVHHHTHRQDDILSVLRLQKEFGFKLVLHHVSDGWKVVDEIRAAGVGVSHNLLDSPGGKEESRHRTWELGGILERAGVPFAFQTDDPIIDSRFMRRAAALGVRAGMSREAALRGLTLTGAEMLNLQDRVGSFEPGKDADFVVLSGDPFSYKTQLEQTWIEGVKVFDRRTTEGRLASTGGVGAGERTFQATCCLLDDED